MSKLQKKPVELKREHPALQNMKFLNLFLFLWVIFAGSGFGSSDLIESGSNPDPKHWVRLLFFYPGIEFAKVILKKI
jgi:hypothetical protein